MEEKPKPFDVVGFIMAMESDDPPELEDRIRGVQAMIDSGVVWQLQGTWQRMASRMIEAGICHPQRKEP